MIICPRPLETGLRYRANSSRMVATGNALYIWGVHSDALVQKAAPSHRRSRQFRKPWACLRVGAINCGHAACEESSAADFYIKTLHHRTTPPRS